MALTVDERFQEVATRPKREIIYVTSSNTDAGTVETLLAGARHVSITGADGSVTDTGVSVSVSGKTITVSDPDASTYRIVVEGF